MLGLFECGAGVGDGLLGVALTTLAVPEFGLGSGERVVATGGRRRRRLLGGREVGGGGGAECSGTEGERVVGVNGAAG